MATKDLNPNDVKSSSPNNSSKMATSNSSKTNKRIICNKYSWVKQGIGIKCGKFAALKCGVKYDTDASKKLKQEITVSKNLKHPNIIRLYAYSSDEKHPHKDGVSTSRIILLPSHAFLQAKYQFIYNTNNE